VETFPGDSATFRAFLLLLVFSKKKKKTLLISDAKVVNFCADAMEKGLDEILPQRKLFMKH